MTAVKMAKEKYIEAVGRRKTSMARVRIAVAAKNIFLTNDKELKDYFFTDDLRRVALEALEKVKPVPKLSITAKIKGGGMNSQAEALRHALSRALILLDPELRRKLKKAGFLKRDPRMKERRKFGLKKARKAPQWSKR